MSISKKLIVILGQTSSGKSDLAIKLALYIKNNLNKFGVKGAVIISADSRQIYKGLEVGSGQITKKESGGIEHRLISIVSPRKIITAEKFGQIARKEIEKTLKNNKIPILCGGTGFYIDSILKDKKFPNVKPDYKLRKKLHKKSLEDLFLELEKKDPKRALNIDRKNKVRLIRALEIVRKTGKPVPNIKERNIYNVLKLGIKKEKKWLKEKIEKRIERMVKNGLIRETRDLKEIYKLSRKRIEGLGFEYLNPLLFLEGKIDKKEMIKNLIEENLKYSKRQMTWFKKDKEINWIYNKQKAAKMVSDFLKKD